MGFDTVSGVVNQIGQVQISPDFYTGLARLKDIAVRRGEMVLVPFMPDPSVQVDNISGTASFNQAMLMYNPCGDSSGFYLSVASDAARAGKGVKVWVPFYGRSFGLCWQRDQNACDFDVVIDGVAHRIHGKPFRSLYEVPNAIDPYAFEIIDEDLVGDGPHYAEIVVVADASATNSINIFGYIVEKQAGYGTQQRGYLNIVASGTVPNAAASPSSGSGSSKARGVVKIWLHNTDVSPRTVTFTQNSATVKIFTLAAGASDEWKFDGNLCFSSLFKFVADAANVVNYAVISST